MRLEALFDRILVQKEETETMTKGGLFIPEQAKEKPNRGTIIGAGPGRTTDHGVFIPMVLKVGDRVLFGKYAGSMVLLDGEEVWILKESDIFAYVHDVEGEGETASKSEVQS